MLIKSLVLKNFRCFESTTLQFDEPLVLITGNNGSGKSSLLEALHYCCYLRSFRTHAPREMIAFDQQNFFIKVTLQTSASVIDNEHSIQVGFAGNKRLIKVDQQAVQSYKELIKLYSIVTLSEDDLDLIKGSPECRRLFLDQALSMQHAGYVPLMRRYKHILQHRNALIARNSFSADDYAMWTAQLWHYMSEIQQERRQFLHTLAQRVNYLIDAWFAQENVHISFSYKPKQGEFSCSLEDFLQNNKNIEFSERKMGRSLIGSHLDDIAIQFRHKISRTYASRGQQKLILVLIKVAQAQMLVEQGFSAILLLDDFMADFDPKNGGILMNILLSLKTQIILTAPALTHSDQEFLLKTGAQHIRLPLKPQSFVTD